MHNVRGNLPQRDHAHFARAYCAEEFFAVVANTLALVPVREPQIEHFFASVLAAARCYQLTRTAQSGAEAVDEPVEPRKRRGFEHLQAGNWARIPLGMHRRYTVTAFGRFSVVGVLSIGS